jgi:cobyrinic acid a,c-diamide synthase
MAALKARGLKVQPFKVGPDFIDPGFHARITGYESRNLDGWMLSRDYNRVLFQRLLAETDGAVIEGVMGLFDGYDGRSEQGSSAQMAKWLGLPVVLVVDARSMARSAAALVYGYSRFDPELSVAGVIFNRVAGSGHFNYLRDAMQHSLPGVTVIGSIPRDARVTIPERHLGLVIAEEIALEGGWQDHLRDLAETHLDLDLLCEKAVHQHGVASEVERTMQSAQPTDPPVPIAVARDAAFCFYYPDNLELLRQAGAELISFSPVAGESFPQHVAGLYLGGGYPELYAENLSRQNRFMNDIRNAAARGMPIYAECGGLMTLSRFIETGSGEKHPMAGILPFGTRMLPRRKALGYTEVVLRRSCPLGEPGLRIRGHEFHYSEIAEQDSGIYDNPAPLELAYELQGRHGRAPVCEGYQLGSVLASYVHLHFGSAREVAQNWVARCRNHQRMK